MNCHEATDVLEMYIAGELPESESLDVVAHLATCDECAAEYERLRVLIGGMRASPIHSCRWSDSPYLRPPSSHGVQAGGGVPPPLRRCLWRRFR